MAGMANQNEMRHGSTNDVEKQIFSADFLAVIIL